MRTIGITGSAGFLGWHTRCLLATHDGVRVVAADRSVFDSNKAVQEFVRQCDAIIHFAGLNRGEDEDILSVNPHLATLLVQAMEETSHVPHVLHSSSTHIDKNTPYARSKRKSAEIFDKWAKKSGGKFTNVVLPNLFGECGKPFYNSVVSTFCHQLARNESPKVDNDVEIELLHAQDASRTFLEFIVSEEVGIVRPRGEMVRVSELLNRLHGLKKSYGDGIIPRLEDPFTLQLFNTYRSYLYPNQFPKYLQLHTDDRGSLFEAVKTLHGGQAFLSTTLPGITRGNHFHLGKIERFLVIKGEAIIRLRKLFDKNVIEYAVNGNTPSFVDMPTLYTHSITNTGSEELLTLFWSHELFDNNAPDTYSESVLM